MKKAVILFIVFTALDIILYFILVRTHGITYFNSVLLPLMFIEIATYGSFILYDINKKGQKKDE